MHNNESSFDICYTTQLYKHFLLGLESPYCKIVHLPRTQEQQNPRPATGALTTLPLISQCDTTIRNREMRYDTHKDKQHIQDDHVYTDIAECTSA